MKLSKAITLIGVFMLMASCASTPKAPKAYCSDGRELPRWTTMGAAAFPADRGKVFYGLGKASNISNAALLSETADNRALGEVAKTFQVSVKSLMDDYRASTSAADKESAEQHVEAVNRTVVNQTLSGVTVVDRCDDRQSGIFYSLASLDTAAFADAISKHKELGQKMQEYVKANAAKAFEKLEKATGDEK